MKITVTKTEQIVTVDLTNEANGNDFNLRLTPEDARILSEKLLAALAGI
jgi:hypothetical protein